MLSFAVLIVEIWVFTLIGLLLHRLNHRLGLAPLLFYVSALMAILNFAELLALHIEPIPGIVLRTGGHVFVPTILMIVLVLYVADGTHPAQLVIYSLTGVNIVVLIVLGFLMLYQNVYDADTQFRGLLTSQELITPEFVRGVIASLIAFVVDMLMIAVVYQGARNVLPRTPGWLFVGLALMAALWTDSILFNILYFLGTENFVVLLPGDVLAKTLAALIIWPPAAYYLERVAPRMVGYVGTAGRPTLDLIFGVFGRLSWTLEQLQAELRESQVTYRQLTENISEIFWLAGVNGDPFYYLNPAFEVVTGHRRAAFYRRPEAFFQIVHPEDRARITSNLRDYLLNTPEDEFRIVRPDGDIRWIRSRVFLIYNQQGQVYRLVGLAEDITERKASETQRHSLELEQEKVKLLQGFIRDASHDLKTPLAAIKLKVGLLRRVKDPADWTRHLDGLEERTDYLDQLIDDLFTLSRLESGAPAFAPQDMHRILRDVYETTQPLANRKNLSMRLNLCDSDSLVVMGDPHELNRALTNLTVNAVRYSQEGWVELRTKRQNDHTCVIEVEDTGIGIDPVEQTSIFERFYRAANAREKKIEGTGLGLSIVRAIIERHHGSVDVESHLGKGTVFRVQLPMIETPIRAQDP